MKLLRKLRALFRKERLDAEMAEEMRQHLDAQMRRNLALGMSLEDAHYAARRSFGGEEQLKERCRDQRGWRWLEQLRQDVRYATRTLIHTPVFTAVAIVSLALGIGANTAIFSLVNGILLSSLPVPNPHELRVLRWSGADMKRGMVSGSIDSIGGDRALSDAFTFPQYLNLRKQGAAQADIFGYAELNGISAVARQAPFVAEGLMVSDNFFSGLGVRPVAGRLFAAGDDDPGAAPMVVISYDWWEKHFELDPSAVGRTASLNGNAFTVIGVLPRGFHGVSLDATGGFYVPMSAQPLLAANWSTTAPDHWWIHLLSRKRKATADGQLQAALDGAFSPLAAEVMRAPRIEISPGRAGAAYDQKFYRKPLMILLGVVGLVILIACANLAGLSLARGAARQHEFAVRAALGSGRWRLIRQSLTESALLAVAGGAAGLLLAFWGKTAISRLLAGSPEGLRYDLSLDFAILGFTFALTLVTALLTGLLPAWRAGKVDPLAGLKARGSLGTPRLRVGRVLVAAQIALSVLLLAGAGLYVRTLVNLIRINPGFAAENLLLFQVSPRAAGLRGPAITQFYERALDSLEKIPGVQAVAVSQYKLLAGMMSGGGFFTLPSNPESKRPQAHRLNVSESFFATMGIPVVQGRGFTSADTDGAPKVVVVNQVFVSKYFPDRTPLGQTIKVRNDLWTVIGVCRDAKYTSLKKEAPPTVYFSYRQDSTATAYFAVRTNLAPTAVISAARKALTGVDPKVPLADVTTEEAVRDKSISQETMFATLVGTLAALALLLACIGLYGLMAYNVTRRTGEIGIRMALGATRRDIAWPVLREALLLSVAGLGLGIPVALALARLIESQLYGVAAHDPATFVVGALVLFIVAALAAWLPARRAARVDPLVALRTE